MEVGEFYVHRITNKPYFYTEDINKGCLIDLTNGDYISEFEGEFLINLIKECKQKIYVDGIQAVRILDVVYNLNVMSSESFDYYWYSTIDESSGLVKGTEYIEQPVTYINLLLQNIAYYKPKYIYVKKHEADTYCIRYNILYDEQDNQEKKVEEVKKQDNKDEGETNTMQNFKDLFTFKQIDVKMDFMSGNLVLDDEGYYFNNGQVMQTLPEMTVEMPAYIISTPVAQLAIGDIILHNDEYVYLLKTAKNFEGINLKGEIVKFSVPTHAVFGTNMQMLPKVMSLFQNMNGGAMAQTTFGQFNPVMFAFMGEADRGEKITMEKLMKYNFYAQMMSNFQHNVMPNVTTTPKADTDIIITPLNNVNKNTTNAEENFEEGEDGVTE